MTECMHRSTHQTTLQIVDFIDSDDEMKPTGETVTFKHDQCYLDEDHEGPHRGWHSEWPQA